VLAHRRVGLLVETRGTRVTGTARFNQTYPADESPKPRVHRN